MRMKVLVIDDSSVHLTAATQTLEGHDVTLCSTADMALDFLEVKYDESRYEGVMSELGWGKDSTVKFDQEKWSKAYITARGAARMPYWDVVLTDLLMPAPKRTQGEEGLKYVGSMMPVGWAFVAQAAANGAKYVACATDLNHHNHPASAMLDAFKEKKIQMAGAVTMYMHSPMVPVVGTVCDACGGSLKSADGDKCWVCFYSADGKEGKSTGMAKGKDWGKILHRLTEPEVAK